MKTDANKNITNIQYNFLNLPTQVTINGRNIMYVYDATGTKLRKTVNGVTTDYAGNFIYENNVLQFFNQPEGYVEPSGSNFNYVYQYKDHLGNIRLSYKDISLTNTPSLQIVEENNYYPFGLEHKGYNNNINGVENNFKTYLGQELNKELGLNWLTFRHRNYMPDIGRFFGIDPISEDYMSISTYQFAHNNPVWKIEIEGLEGHETSGTDIINIEKVKFFQPNIQPVGKIFSASGTISGTVGPKASFGVSLGKNFKLRESISVVKASGTITSDPSLKGEVSLINVGGSLTAPGIGESTVSMSFGELTGTLNEDGFKGDISLGVLTGEAKIEGGPSTSLSGTIVSSNEDKNGKLTKGKVEGGDFSGTLSRDRAGLGVKVGPVTVAISAKLDEAKKAVSNFFNRLADLVINGVSKQKKD